MDSVMPPHMPNGQGPFGTEQDAQDQHQHQQQQHPEQEFDWNAFAQILAEFDPDTWFPEPDQQLTADSIGFQIQLQGGSPIELPQEFETGLPNQDQPQPQPQPQPLHHGTTGPQFSWSDVSGEIVQNILGNYTSAIFAIGSLRPLIDLYRQVPDSDDDVFSSLNQPRASLDYGLFDPARRLPLYRAEDIIRHHQEAEENFIRRFEQLHSDLAQAIASCQEPAGSELSDWDAELNATITRRFQNFIRRTPWAVDLFERCDCLSEAETRRTKSACGAVSDYQNLMAALVRLCWMTLYWKYGDIDTGEDTVPQDFYASCFVEARRWTLRIVRGWIQEAWDQWMRKFVNPGFQAPL